MPSPAPQKPLSGRKPSVVLLATGGTIAGAAARSQDLSHYKAGALDATALVAAVPALASLPLRLKVETLARLDSSNMDHSTWWALLQRLRQLLAMPSVSGVVVTHGTDTLEETAYFLHRTLDTAGKPVVFTAAMRPATAVSADGPQNLLDAVQLAARAGVQGVLLAFGGQVLAGAELRKVHGYRLDAFDTGGAGPLALLEDADLRQLRAWPSSSLHPAAAHLPPPASWPLVDIITSHAGADGRLLQAAADSGAQGLVIAGSGNGSVHDRLQAVADSLVAQGLPVWRSSRCLLGGVVGQRADRLPHRGGLTPAQARVELMLELMQQPKLKPKTKLKTKPALRGRTKA